MMTRILHFIDSLSAWSGKAFAWCIVILTFSTCYEVFMRYVLNAPTVWAFDMSVQMYGALFMMSGAYALSQDAHVRGDVVYRLLKIKTQAKIDLVLYILFLMPGALALITTAMVLPPIPGFTRRSAGAAHREFKSISSKP